MRMLILTFLLFSSTSFSATEMTRDDCISQESKEINIKVAMRFMDGKEAGVTEREAITWALETESPAVRAAFLTAIGKVYGGYASISSTATAMQIACYEAATE